METQTKLMKLTTVTTLIAMFAVILQPAQVDAATAKHIRIRIGHAKELLGKRYKTSVVRKTEGSDDVNEFVNETIKRFLPTSYKPQSKKIASTLMTESERYGFDPIFLMAVIQNESSFNPKMKGSFGEIGLMQVKPSTAEWIAKTYKIKYTDSKSLLEPEMNIKIGAAFMHKLRSQFASKSGLYVSAYNIGAKNVRKMVSGKKTPKEYVTAVMKRYLAIYTGFNTDGNNQQRGQMAWVKISNVTHPVVVSN